MSCYTLKPNDAIESLFVYSEADFESNQLTPIDRFQELQVTESGWRKFPSVYETNGTNWLRVKEGWIHFTRVYQIPKRYKYLSTLIYFGEEPDIVFNDLVKTICNLFDLFSNPMIFAFYKGYTDFKFLHYAELLKRSDDIHSRLI